MAQLVGSTCVICQQRIVDAPSAQFCPECNNPVHSQCAQDYHPQAGASGCSRCGGTPGAAPAQTAVAPFDPVPTLVVLGVLVIAIAVYILWPSSPRPSRRPAAAPETTSSVTQNKEAASTMDKNPIVEIKTTKGTIRARLFVDKAPETANNFIELVNQKFYDGIIFHRVIKDFMLQTGDPTGTGTGGRTDKGLPAKKLLDEFHPDLKHDREGLLSMANAGPNTGDTQFFITCVPTPWLDNKHAIFGEVIEGMDVVHAIEKAPTAPNDRPIDEVKMTSVRMVEPEN